GSGAEKEESRENRRPSSHVHLPAEGAPSYQTPVHVAGQKSTPELVTAPAGARSSRDADATGAPLAARRHVGRGRRELRASRRTGGGGLAAALRARQRRCAG